MQIVAVGADGERGTPELLRLVGVQLETVGRHPSVYIVYARRQTLLKIMYSRLAGGLVERYI